MKAGSLPDPDGAGRVALWADQNATGDRTSLVAGSEETHPVALGRTVKFVHSWVPRFGSCGADPHVASLLTVEVARKSPPPT